MGSTISVHHGIVILPSSQDKGSRDRSFAWNRTFPDYTWERFWTASPINRSLPNVTYMVSYQGVADMGGTSHYIVGETAFLQRPAL